MVTLDLGDELCVVVWREGLGRNPPLGYPITDPTYSGKPIEVVDGEVNTVVRIRIDGETAEKLIGRVVGQIQPGTDEWEEAQEILSTEYDLEAEEIEQDGRTRLVLRSSKDFHNQWLKHKKETFGKLPDHQ